MLVVPDICNFKTLDHMLQVLTRLFRNISLQSEAMSTVYGSSVATACIVDVGTSGYSVMCVEDGALIAKSRILVDGVGSRLVTRTFKELLSLHNFNPQVSDY